MLFRSALWWQARLGLAPRPSQTPAEIALAFSRLARRREAESRGPAAALSRRLEAARRLAGALAEMERSFERVTYGTGAAAWRQHQAVERAWRDFRRLIPLALLLRLTTRPGD